MKKGTDRGKLVYLSTNVLLTHPKNLRRFYPDNQVREMAESIRAAKGVHQALLIVPNGKAGRYFVVDGNMRLVGAKHLGKDCPKLKCEMVDQGTADQLLTMAATAKFRYDPDPISEALHYKRLMDEEGYNVPNLGRALGISPSQLYQQLKLLQLDPEIQSLIARKKLPRDARAVDALLAVPDAKARIKLAERMAELEASVKAIVEACARLKDQLLVKKAKVNSPSSPAMAIGQGRAFGKKADPKTPVKVKDVRRAAQAVCVACSIRETSLVKSAEPAWAMISHAADETCKVCSMREVRNTCGSCPAVNLLRRLVLDIGTRPAA